MKLTSEPGLIVSGVAHAALLVAVLVAFAGAKKFVDAQEAIPVEMLTQSEFNEIMKGDKAAKEVKPVPQMAEKIAAATPPTPRPVVPDTEADAPVPPPPLKRLPEPVAEDVPAPKPLPSKPLPSRPAPAKPEPVNVVQPPPRPHSEPVKVAQVAPPMPTPPAPTPPARPETVKPEPPKPMPPKLEAKVEPPLDPDDAEVVVPKPRPLPKVEPPKPVVAIAPPVVVPAPVVPKKIRPMEHPKAVAAVEPPKPDAVARLLEQKPVPEPVKPQVRPDVPTPAVKLPPEPAPPKAVAAVAPTPAVAPQRVYDPDSIAKLLNRDKPKQVPAAAPEVTHTASIGAPTQNAPRMSPTMTATLDGLMMDQYNQCWPDNGMDGHGYVPQIRVQFGPDGMLLGQPSLVNPPSDPALHSLAEDALRAVRKCNPLKIPAQYAPYYEQWKQRLLRFDPAERTG